MGETDIKEVRIERAIVSYFNPKVIYAKAGEKATVIARHDDILILRSRSNRTFSSHINNVKILSNAEEKNKSH